MKKLTKEKLIELEDFLYELELQTGLCTLQKLSEDTDMEEFIENFRQEMIDNDFPVNGFDAIYADDINESTDRANKTFLEILNEYK